MFHFRSNTIESESINIIGAIDLLFGSNYINTLRLNDITPEMEHNIVNYEIV